MCGSFFFFFSEIIVQYNFFFLVGARCSLTEVGARCSLTEVGARCSLTFFFGCFFVGARCSLNFFFFCWRSLLADRSLRSLLADFLLFFFCWRSLLAARLLFFFLFLYTISVPRGTQHSVFLRSADFVWHQCNFGSENGFLAVKLKNFSKASCLKHSLSVFCVANRHCLL